MLSQKKHDTISGTLIRTAVKNWDEVSESYTFEMHGETCKASLRDTLSDEEEFSESV
jgi:hypothetical protein